MYLLALSLLDGQNFHPFIIPLPPPHLLPSFCTCTPWCTPGSQVDLLDVVNGGSRHIHGVLKGFSAQTPSTIVTVSSLDAGIITAGHPNGLPTPVDLAPDFSHGASVVLWDNLWGACGLAISGLSSSSSSSSFFFSMGDLFLFIFLFFLYPFYYLFF